MNSSSTKFLLSAASVILVAAAAWFASGPQLVHADQLDVVGGQCFANLCFCEQGDLWDCTGLCTGTITFTAEIVGSGLWGSSPEHCDGAPGCEDIDGAFCWLCT